MSCVGTFHTVKAEITSATLTSVCIKCTLKTGSTSQGCVVIFQDTSGKNGNISRQIDRTPGEVIAYKCIEDLPDGIYKVLITDSEIYQENDDGSIAFQMNSNVIIMRPTGSTDAKENIEDETSIAIFIIIILINSKKRLVSIITIIIVNTLWLTIYNITMAMPQISLQVL